ncbi:hypothetical protein [Sphingopyxis sp. BSNA05]|uniref:hypothetical protein n=1 Tax=Sphingopyxis sp. BSNA05 TaxID=1236614 RepID=UPI0020B8F9B7|nr:hypothetical protein [Sphingopyxis sp. BSNA05]
MTDGILGVLSALTYIFILLLGLGLAAVIVLFIIDINQKQDAVRRNYPVIGRFRHLFSELGEFFRQYFFAMDREEMPFNRAEREWVERAGKGIDNTIAFGSTKSLDPPGTAILSMFRFPRWKAMRRKRRPASSGRTRDNPMKPDPSSIFPR